MFSRLKDEEDDATVSKGHVPWEVELLGDKRLKMVETDVSYAGERPSMLSFVFQFRDIVFRFNGSVLPFVLIECFIAVALSFIALYAVPDEEFSHLGGPEGSAAMTPMVAAYVRYAARLRTARSV